MANQSFNYEDIQKDYGDMTDMIIQNFESTCFDSKMQQLIDEILNENWTRAMLTSHTLRGASNFIKAEPFRETLDAFKTFIKHHSEPIHYPMDEPYREDRPVYKLKDEFDDEKKLQAYEYFHPIIEQARLLKFEIQKYTKSQITEDIFLEEGEKVKLMHQKLIEHSKIKQVCGNLIQKEQNQKTNQNQKNNNYKTQPKNNNVGSNIVFEPPQNDKFCNKCYIF